MHQLEEATRSYRQALALAPSLSHAHYNLGLVFTEQGKHEAAISCYRAVLAITPDDAPSHNNLGIALFRLGILMKPPNITQAITLKPDYPEAHNHLGIAMAINPAMRSDAIRHYRRALTLKPDYAEAYNNLAAAISVDSLDEATEYYRRAIDSNRLRRGSLQSVPCPPAYG